MQHVDVQGVALDPLPAVEQPAHQPDLLRDPDTADVLDRVARAHLVGDGADAADPRGDVRWLGVSTAAQQCLEEPRRLVDPELHVGDVPVAQHHAHGALALDAGQRVHSELAPRPGALVRHRVGSGSVEVSRALRRRRPGAAALNVRNTLCMSRSGIPSSLSRRLSDGVFVVSAGPKHP